MPMLSIRAMAKDIGHLELRATTGVTRWFHNNSFKEGKSIVVEARAWEAAINFCDYTRGLSADYDNWAELVDDAAWSWKNAHRLFQKVVVRRRSSALSQAVSWG